MNVISKVLSMTAVFFIVFTVSAETNLCTTGDTTKIYFVNGVWNTLPQARDSSNRIKTAYKRNLENEYPNQNFDFKESYNYHAGKVRDVIEVIGQKINEIDDPEVSDITAAEYFRMYMVARTFDELVPPNARPITTTIEEYLAGRVTDAVDSASHIQRYRADLLEGKRVLLMAHSQGNMFANKAIAALMGEYPNSIAMIGVASPAAVTYNNTPYYTAHDDRVIDALRIIHDVLPSNIDNDPGFFDDPRDFSNHQFAPSYFASGIASRDKIDNDVDYFMSVLEFPAPEIGDGIITVTLEWGAQPDVDLHTYEPNGIHVYYSNRRGASGYLDVDDTSSYGPEHYFVSCETLETGIYDIGVNYYRGSGTETARVQIEAGLLTRNFSVPLSTAVGSSGDNSPISVASIVVSGDSENGFDFAIQ